MTPENFIKKWENSTLKERSASQSHFNDLCAVLGVENPIDADQKGDWYCFERGASKTAGGEGWADVWKRGHFGWEYKGKRKDLKAAFAQLQQYAVALENPPLLVVSDMDRIIVHTNWTNTVSETHEIKLEELTNPNKRELLRWVFLDPNRLKPEKTIDALTREVADKFASLAIRLHERGFDPKKVAHFVNRLVFCMFAEDINLLPRQLFTQILDRSHTRPELSEKLFSQLFASMKKGGLFGVEEIKWFNGGLFDDATAIALSRDELKLVGQAAALDWTDIDPSIFGTLFERGLDPAKRSQLGAHYTDPEKIMMIVRPVIIEPLWQEWEGIKAAIQKPRTSEKRKRELLGGFLERLKRFRVLDPACGSGNFLYLALLALKDIEHRVNLEAEAMGFGKQLPTVGPEAVLGIELNPYAAELARVSIWIGEIQWMRKNGFGVNENPILKQLNNIENRDSILNSDGTESAWPTADVIIGNPPFLGRQDISESLGRSYVTALRAVFSEKVSGQADFVTYWFTKALDYLDKNTLCGFVSTNSIRRGVNKTVLDAVIAKTDIFLAYSDMPWMSDGAAVRVSIVCFGQRGIAPVLDGQSVDYIHSDLTKATRGTGSPKPLAENKGVAFVGGQKDGPFEISRSEAKRLLKLPANPNGRTNADVVRPWCNGRYLARGGEDVWIIDFGEKSLDEAAFYEEPFKLVQERVKPIREINNDPRRKRLWWTHGRTGGNAKTALGDQNEFLATPLTSKHRWFVRLNKSRFPDNTTVLITHSDWITFGILSSKYHTLWAFRFGNFLGVGNDSRYTPSTTFETFPFPASLMPNIPLEKKQKLKHAIAIATAAEKLHDWRDQWLKPADLVILAPDLLPQLPKRILPKDGAAEEELRKRNLTALYNSRPTWLTNAHKTLDAAVSAAYGWPADLGDDDILGRLLALNLERAAT